MGCGHTHPFSLTREKNNDNNTTTTLQQQHNNTTTTRNNNTTTTATTTTTQQHKQQHAREKNNTKTTTRNNNDYQNNDNNKNTKCKSGKPRKTCKCALCTVDDTCCSHVIQLGPKTSVHEKHASVKSTVTGCDVTNCATTLQGFNKHASSRREAVSDSRGVPRCTEKNFTNLRLPTCVDRSTRPIHHTRIQ